ncbi:2973_t:CDS:1, partial [Cetraspora pellucida]
MVHIAASNIIDDNASDNEHIISNNNYSLVSQYFVTFECNKHKETIIDHMIDDNDMDENLLKYKDKILQILGILNMKKVRKNWA